MASPSPTLDDLDTDARRLAEDCVAWADQWWDDEVALPWGPPGHEAIPRPRSLHLMPQAGWHAVGLFLRNRGDDRERALRTIDAVCALQYDEPGTDWHGTYPIMAESPHPPSPATMWQDYDPNWRQFLGLSWMVLLQRFRGDLPDRTVATLERAVRLGVEGEPPDRCPPTYTNIALKRVALESMAGALLDEPAWVDRAERLADQVVERHDRHGAVEEFNSPTYAGVDLFALSLARQLSPSATIRDHATGLEAALWRSLASWYHPGLANLAAPWTRTYGMDMGSYVAKVMLSLRLVAPEVAPDPGLAPEVAHGHDLFAGAITALVGTDCPDDARADLRRIDEGLREQAISGSRTATAWFSPTVVAGAERARADLSWWDQYVAAALHWETPEGGVGWLSVRMPGPSGATAGEGRLTVPVGDGGAALVNIGGIDPPAPPSRGRWVLPGLDLAISTELTATGPGPFGGHAFAAPARSGVDLVVEGAG